MTEQGPNETVIGSDTSIKGDMVVENRARIYGKFEGTIRSKGEIHLADKARCKAAVEANIVQVDGSLDGDITASEKASLNATARVKGDLVASRLKVAEGAAINGHVSVGPDAVKGKSGGAAAAGSSDTREPRK